MELWIKSLLLERLIITQIFRTFIFQHEFPLMCNFNGLFVFSHTRSSVFLTLRSQFRSAAHLSFPHSPMGVVNDVQIHSLTVSFPMIKAVRVHV